MTYKILVADDYESNLAVIESIFEDAGQDFQILYAHDGRSACEQAIQHQPDLIIMDWEMPLMSGIDAVRFLKSEEKTKHIPIIMTTAFSSSEHLEKALKTGATDYVRKPIDEIELLARVNSALQIVTSYKQIIAQKNEIEQKTNKLEQAFDEIEKKNTKIMSSINYAKRIQDAMLPKPSSIQEIIPDSFVLFRPRDVVSGDFYWFMIKEERIILAAVDCTGHGVPGAFMSMLGDTYLSQIVGILDITDPSKILEALDQSIRKALKQEETENRDGMDIGICSIDTVKGIVEYSGAKIPLVMIQGNEVQIIKGSPVSIGGTYKKGDKIFETHKLQVEKTTAFYMYSDGFQDQFNIKMGVKFMAKRFRKLLQKVHRFPFEEQKKILNHILEDWMRGTKQIDDVLVLGFQIKPDTTSKEV